MHSNLITDFRERLQEVDAYLSFLSTIETQIQNGPPRIQGAAHPITAQQQRILYSGVYLQLYNLVEATMSQCIKAVMEAIQNSSQKPYELNEPLMREWVRMIARTHTEMTYEKRLEYALELCRYLVDALPINSFDIDAGGGGNWDDSKIEMFVKRLGIDFKVGEEIRSSVKRPFENEMGALVLVKNRRNHLAHGSISFAQCAEDVTVSQLLDLKEITTNYLSELVDHFASYISNYEYLVYEKRP